MSTDYRPEGFRAVTSGLSVEGSNALLEFLVRAFDAQPRDLTRDDQGRIRHGEIQIGDSIVEISEARPEWPAKPTAIHYYVPDTDACYARAVAAGAIPVTPPRDEPYGDRAAAVTDPAGNFWFIATRLIGAPVPAGFHSLTPYLLTAAADEVMAFLTRTFGAVVQSRVESPEGTVMHAEVRIDDAMVELSDGGPAWPPRRSCLHVYVADVDAAYRRAIEAGGTSLYGPQDQPYGDRECGIEDPGGNYWFIGSRVRAATAAAKQA